MWAGSKSSKEEQDEVKQEPKEKKRKRFGKCLFCCAESICATVYYDKTSLKFALEIAWQHA